VVAVAEDDDVLAAVGKAREKGFIEPVLIGNKDLIREAAKRAGFNISAVETVHEPVPASACEFAARMIAEGKAQY